MLSSAAIRREAALWLFHFQFISDARSDVVELLVLMHASQSRKDAVSKLDRWFSKPGLPTKSVIRADAMEILHDLVVDLSYYVLDPSMRAQDSGYFGDDRLLKEVTTALNQLSELGVPMPGSYATKCRQ